MHQVASAFEPIRREPEVFALDREQPLNSFVTLVWIQPRKRFEPLLSACPDEPGRRRTLGINFGQTRASPWPVRSIDDRTVAMPHADFRLVVVTDKDDCGLERRRQECGTRQGTSTIKDGHSIRGGDRHRFRCGKRCHILAITAGLSQQLVQCFVWQPARIKARCPDSCDAFLFAHSKRFTVATKRDATVANPPGQTSNQTYRCASHRLRAYVILLRLCARRTRRARGGASRIRRTQSFGWCRHWLNRDHNESYRRGPIARGHKSTRDELSALG